MSQIQRALRTMGLEPGASKEAIATRYKRLIMVWHPDRFPTADGKADAEEELKKINNAKDILYKHFDSGAHRASGCECQADGATSGSGGAENKTKSGGAAHDSRSTYDAEEEARRRDQERRRKASEAKAESERKQREEQAKRAAESQTFDDAKRQQAALKDNDLRWKVAVAQVIVYFGLIGYAWTGHSLKSWWHDVSWKWEQEHKAPDPTPTPTPTPIPTPTPSPSPFGPPGPPPDSNSNMLPNGVMKPLDNSRVPVPNYPPRTDTGTTTDTTPGFNWKPLTPGATPPSDYERVAPGLPQSNTDNESILDKWSKIKTLPSGTSTTTAPSAYGQVAPKIEPQTNSSSNPLRTFDLDKYVKDSSKPRRIDTPSQTGVLTSPLRPFDPDRYLKDSQ